MLSTIHLACSRGFDWWCYRAGFEIMVISLWKRREKHVVPFITLAWDWKVLMSNGCRVCRRVHSEDIIKLIPEHIRDSLCILEELWLFDSSVSWWWRAKWSLMTQSLQKILVHQPSRTHCLLLPQQAAQVCIARKLSTNEQFHSCLSSTLKPSTNQENEINWPPW